MNRKLSFLLLALFLLSATLFGQQQPVGNNGRIAVPEWEFVDRVKMDAGAELWEVYSDGKTVLRGIASDVNDKLKFIKQ